MIPSQKSVKLTHQGYYGQQPETLKLLVGPRGAVDRRQMRVHFSWKPILNSFKKMCQPVCKSRSTLTVTNRESVTNLTGKTMQGFVSMEA